MSTKREPVVAVVACEDTVLVARAGQDTLAITRDAWRRFLAEVKAGRWDRPS